MTCNHECTRANGKGVLACRKCGAVYEIGLAGARWVGGVAHETLEEYMSRKHYLEELRPKPDWYK